MGEGVEDDVGLVGEDIAYEGKRRAEGEKVGEMGVWNVFS